MDIIIYLVEFQAHLQVSLRCATMG